MPTMTLRFATWIHERHYDELSIYGVHGAVFHRWLPDGEADAIKLSLPKESTEVSLWFPREGVVDHGFIKYQAGANEVDPEVMARQAILTTGALRGSVTVKNVCDDEYNSVKSNALESDGYKSFAKRIVKTVVDPVLRRFTSILRDIYGQYWIRNWTTFDSRECSIGHHCADLRLKWLDDNGDWQKFQPEKRLFGGVIRAKAIPKKEYLDRDDWQVIGELLVSHEEFPMPYAIASRANRLFEHGRAAHAIVEAATALEVAVSYTVKSKLGCHSELEAISQSFLGRNQQKVQVAVLASMLGIAVDDIKKAVTAIELRNAIVHEGKQVARGEVEECFPAVLRVLRSLLDGPSPKYPRLVNGNEQSY